MTLSTVELMIDDNGESGQAGSAPISDHILKSGSNANGFA
jgi:hypothetical protein